MYQPLPVTADKNKQLPVDPRIPTLLICGVETSGKFRLITRITSDAIADGNACAIIFADEASWAAAWKGGTRISKNIARSNSGLVCCYAASDMVDAFYQLHLRRLGLLSPKLEYDTILVSIDETLSAGWFVHAAQNNDRIDATYRIAKIVSVLDPISFKWNFEDFQANCVGEADTLILTSSGDLDEKDLTGMRSRLTMFNPLAAIFCSTHPSIRALPAWHIPLGYFSEDNGRSFSRETGMVRLNGGHTESTCFCGNLYNMAGTNSSDDSFTVRAMRISVPGEIDLSVFMQFLIDLMRSPESQLWRFSALLNVRNADRPISLEIVGGNLIRPSFEFDRQVEKSDICIVASGIDVKQTWRSVAQSTWQSSVSAPSKKCHVI